MAGMAVYGYNTRDSDCRDRKYLYKWNGMQLGSDVYVIMFDLHRPYSHKQSAVFAKADLLLFGHTWSQESEVESQRCLVRMFSFATQLNAQQPQLMNHNQHNVVKDR